MAKFVYGERNLFRASYPRTITTLIGKGFLSSCDPHRHPFLKKVIQSVLLPDTLRHEVGRIEGYINGGLDSWDGKPILAAKEFKEVSFVMTLLKPFLWTALPSFRLVWVLSFLGDHRAYILIFRCWERSLSLTWRMHVLLLRARNAEIENSSDFRADSIDCCAAYLEHCGIFHLWAHRSSRNCWGPSSYWYVSSTIQCHVCHANKSSRFPLVQKSAGDYIPVHHLLIGLFICNFIYSVDQTNARGCDVRLEK